MMNPNMPPKIARMLRTYMVVFGVAIFIVGFISAFTDMFEALNMPELVGYCFMILGLVDILIGLILFKPNDRL
jgi:hypothetical protein